MRKRMVTRTIVSTTCDVKVYHKSTNEVITETHTLSGAFSAETYDKAMKALKKLLENDDTVVVAIISMQNVEHKYGMSEQDFIMFADMLD